MKKRQVLNCSNYLKLIDELDKNIYDKKQLNKLIYEFLSIKSNNESYLKFVEIINVALSISIISSLITIVHPKIYNIIIYQLIFIFIQLIISIIIIKKLIKNINNLNLIIKVLEMKLNENKRIVKRK